MLCQGVVGQTQVQGGQHQVKLQTELYFPGRNLLANPNANNVITGNNPINLITGNGPINENENEDENHITGQTTVNVDDTRSNRLQRTVLKAPTPSPFNANGPTPAPSPIRDDDVADKEREEELFGFGVSNDLNTVEDNEGLIINDQYELFLNTFVKILSQIVPMLLGHATDQWTQIGVYIAGMCLFLAILQCKYNKTLPCCKEDVENLPQSDNALGKQKNCLVNTTWLPEDGLSLFDIGLVFMTGICMPFIDHFYEEGQNPLSTFGGGAHVPKLIVLALSTLIFIQSRYYYSNESPNDETVKANDKNWTLRVVVGLQALLYIDFAETCLGWATQGDSCKWGQFYGHLYTMIAVLAQMVLMYCCFRNSIKHHIFEENISDFRKNRMEDENAEELGSPLKIEQCQFITAFTVPTIGQMVKLNGIDGWELPIIQVWLQFCYQCYYQYFNYCKPQQKLQTARLSQQHLQRQTLVFGEENEEGRQLKFNNGRSSKPMVFGEVERLTQTTQEFERFTQATGRSTQMSVMTQVFGEDLTVTDPRLTYGNH